MRLLKWLLWYRATSGLRLMAFTMYVYHVANVPSPKHVSNNNQPTTFTNPRPINPSTLLTPHASAKQRFWQSSEVNPSLPYTSVKYASALMLYHTIDQFSSGCTLSTWLTNRLATDDRHCSLLDQEDHSSTMRRRAICAACNESYVSHRYK